MNLRSLTASAIWCVGLGLLAGSAGVVRAAEGGATASHADDYDEEEDEYAQPAVYDPFERYNRTIFKFNDGVYRNVMRPVARGYETITPRFARRGLTSFFDNIRYPVRLAGCVLQGKLDRAAAETGKFLVNTTAGVGGFIKVSDRVPQLRVEEEDIGQTLGRWGFGPGPFVMLPVLGPTNLRDIGGWAGDYALTPTNWSFMNKFDWRVRDGVVVLNTVNNLPDIIVAYDTFNRAAIDPYVAFRNGYTQYREAAIRK